MESLAAPNSASAQALTPRSFWERINYPVLAFTRLTVPRGTQEPCGSSVGGNAMLKAVNLWAVIYLQSLCPEAVGQCFQLWDTLRGERNTKPFYFMWHPGANPINLMWTVPTLVHSWPLQGGQCQSGWFGFFFFFSQKSRYPFCLFIILGLTFPLLQT